MILEPIVCNCVKLVGLSLYSIYKCIDTMSTLLTPSLRITQSIHQGVYYETLVGGVSSHCMVFSRTKNKSYPDTQMTPSRRSSAHSGTEPTSNSSLAKVHIEQKEVGLSIGPVQDQYECHLRGSLLISVYYGKFRKIPDPSLECVTVIVGIR